MKTFDLETALRERRVALAEDGARAARCIAAIDVLLGTDEKPCDEPCGDTPEPVRYLCYEEILPLIVDAVNGGAETAREIHVAICSHRNIRSHHALRHHINHAAEDGYLCCVGKGRYKRFINNRRPR
jgi:hypothetical protein